MVQSVCADSRRHQGKLGGVDWFFHKPGLEKYGSLYELKYKLTYKDLKELHLALDTVQTAETLRDLAYRKEMDKNQ